MTPMADPYNAMKHPLTRLLSLTTDFHLDRLSKGITPAKKHKTKDHELHKICASFDQYESILDYMFKIAEYLGHCDYICTLNASQKLLRFILILVLYKIFDSP